MEESRDLEKLAKKPKQLNWLGEPGSDISNDTRWSGVKLGNRLGVASAALTPHKDDSEALAKYTRERDPDGIAWVRDGKKYRPLV